MPSSDFLTWLLSSISTPAMSAHGLLFTVPLIRLLEKQEIRIKDKAPITFNGEPIQIVLARLNAKRNLPGGGRRAAKEGIRAKAKAEARTQATEACKEQKTYEKAFWRAKQWNWRRVEKELRSRHLSFANIALLATEVGVSIAIAGDALMQAAA